MPYTKIWVHLVWATKSRAGVLSKQVRTLLFSHMKSNAKAKEIWLEAIDGYVDHVHCLIRLQATQDIATVVRLLKGESAHWLNEEGVLPGKFQWQADYFAVSVSESGVEAVREYINNQEEHHSKTGFEEEYQAFLKKFTFSPGSK